MHAALLSGMLQIIQCMGQRDDCRCTEIAETPFVVNDIFLHAGLVLEGMLEYMIKNRSNDVQAT